jgi:hypothetical protein
MNCKKGLEVLKSPDRFLNRLILHLGCFLKLEVQVLVVTAFSQKIEHLFLVPLGGVNGNCLVRVMVRVNKFDYRTRSVDDLQCGTL